MKMKKDIPKRRTPLFCILKNLSNPFKKAAIIFQFIEKGHLFFTSYRHLNFS